MHEQFLELIRRSAVDLPRDVIRAIENGRDAEDEDSPACSVLCEILKNCESARDSSRPLCQDTGTNLWLVHHPGSVSEKFLREEILKATRMATERYYLRPNAVDPVTGKNSGDNTGSGAPVMHFREWEKDIVAADLLLKGGGSENVSAQYSLPDASVNAGRDLDGVRKAAVDAVFRAQGQGCAPGIIGVCIGGDRATGMAAAKLQLMRLLDDKNPDRALAELEERIFTECNSLAIGPMGFGGRTTVLGVKVGKLHRVPASYFVSVAYLCWAARRANMEFSNGKAVYSQVSQIARNYILSGVKK